MPQIIPITTTLNPDFQTIIDYNLFWNGEYQQLGEKFIRERIEANRHLPPQEAKRQIGTNLYEFVMGASNYLKERLGE